MIIEVLDELNNRLIVTAFPQWIHVEEDGTKRICLWEDANCININNKLYTINGRYIPGYLLDMKLDSVYIGNCTDERLLTEDLVTNLFNCFIDGNQQSMQLFKYLMNSFIDKLSIDEKLKVPNLIKPWEIGKHYNIGEVFSFDLNSVQEPQLYEVIYAVEAKYGYWPPEHPEWYKPLGVNSDNIPLLQPCFGPEDGYSKDDVVIIDNDKYKSLIDNNVFTKDVPWFNDVWEKID